ncbi:MAG: protein-disulfide reductase DsbD domain-containing protein [Pseudomonadota bacterium]
MFSRALILFLCTLATPALPQSSGMPVDGALLPGWRESDGRHMSGLALDLAPGWKTYWRSPGAGGIPPRFNWSGSRNLASVTVHYPVPKVMDQNGLQSIGYDTDVVFPLVVTAQDASKPVMLRGEVELGVCEEVCIPMTLQVTAELPAGGNHDKAIAASMDNQPVMGGGIECDIAPISDGLRLTARTGSAAFSAEVVVIEVSTPDVWVSPSEMSQSGSNLVAEVEMVPPNAQPFALARSGVRMTLIGNGRALELRGCQ